MLACGSEWSCSLQNGKTPWGINRFCLEPGAQHWVEDNQLPYLQIGGKSIVLMSYVKVKQIINVSCILQMSQDDANISVEGGY